MSMLRLNVLANLLGSGWLAIVQLVVVPVYLRLLGIEGYALIGFYLTLLGVLRIVELGLSPTVSRELARLSVDPSLAGDAQDLTRTLEAFYWGAALAVAALVYVLAPRVAFGWLQETRISGEILVASVRWMGLLAAAQLPISLYQGVLLGLERQPLLNAIRATMATLAALAGVLVLALIASDPASFFLSQIAIAAAQTMLMRAAVWRSLPRAPHRPRMRPAMFLRVYRFALGLGGITVCSVILTQADKIILSRLLPLEVFGYYSLAAVAASALAAMNAPLFNAAFPRLTVLVARGDDGALRSLYRLASQAVVVVTVPVAIAVAVFASEVVAIWTGDPVMAAEVGPLLAILVAGTALNTLMYMPYALQLAHGWTRLAFALNLAFALAIVPALLAAVFTLGAAGAAFVWTAVNLTYVAVGVPATHRRLFGEPGWYWFRDLAAVTAASAASAVVWRLLYFVQPSSAVALLAMVGAILSGAVAATSMCPPLREWTVASVAGRFCRLA
jgi:O-antigen/teichoic acid export membrane protein